MEEYDKINWLRIRMVGLKHWLMWYGLQKRLQNILVAEFPKSGGTWFCKMLTDATGLPLPRDYKIPKFEKSILHGVHFYQERFGKTLYVVRDGRDVMVSAYYYFLFRNEKNLQYGVDRYRNCLLYTSDAADE